MIAGVDLSVLLDAILRRHGPALLDDRQRLFGLLRDYAPERPRDVRLLVTAVDAGIVSRLDELVARGEDAIRSETDRMVEGFGCRADLAAEAVRVWARLAPGIAQMRASTADGAAGTAFSGIQALPSVSPLPPIQPLPGVQPLPGIQPLPPLGSNVPPRPRWRSVAGAVAVGLAAAAAFRRVFGRT